MMHLLALCYVTLIAATGCDQFGGRKDYMYFRAHRDEAKSVMDQCRINGRSGMNQSQLTVCHAAREA